MNKLQNFPSEDEVYSMGYESGLKGLIHYNWKGSFVEQYQKAYDSGYEDGAGDRALITGWDDGQGRFSQFG